MKLDTDWNSADYLKSPAAIAAYLEEMFADHNSPLMNGQVTHVIETIEAAVEAIRRATIEDCAKVADKECEESSDPQQAMTAMGIAAEIRALADKEPS